MRITLPLLNPVCFNRTATEDRQLLRWVKFPTTPAVGQRYEVPNALNHMPCLCSNTSKRQVNQLLTYHIHTQNDTVPPPMRHKTRYRRTSQHTYAKPKVLNVIIREKLLIHGKSKFLNTKCS